MDENSQINDYFRPFDDVLTSICSMEDDMSYIAHDCLITLNFRVPIVCQYAGTVIEFAFTTSTYDISFCVIFEKLNGTKATFIHNSRVNSHTDTITGSFGVNEQGTVYFVWDNSYSWFRQKALSYEIHAYPPSINVTEDARIRKVNFTLKDVIKQKTELELGHRNRLLQVQEMERGLNGLEEQMMQLNQQITIERGRLASATSDASAVYLSLMDQKKVIPGLCIRLLNRHLLAIVFSYLDTTPVRRDLPAADPVYCVCKYWNLAWKERAVSLSHDQHDDNAHQHDDSSRVSADSSERNENGGGGHDDDDKNDTTTTAVTATRGSLKEESKRKHKTTTTKKRKKKKQQNKDDDDDDDDDDDERDDDDDDV